MTLRLPPPWPTNFAHAREVQESLRRRAIAEDLFGHRIGLASAIDIVLRCATRYRLPESVRQADRLASRRPGTLDSSIDPAQ